MTDINDANPGHLIAAGFKEDSPGHYVKGDSVIRYAPHGLDRAFVVWSLDHRFGAHLSTGHVGEALLFARMADNGEDMASAIIGECMQSVAFAMTGKRAALDFGGVDLSAQVWQMLNREAVRFAVLIAQEVQRADGLPKDPPTPDD